LCPLAEQLEQHLGIALVDAEACNEIGARGHSQ
jgi:hypothetical protein